MIIDSKTSYDGYDGPKAHKLTSSQSLQSLSSPLMSSWKYGAWTNEVPPPGNSHVINQRHYLQTC